MLRNLFFSLWLSCNCLAAIAAPSESPPACIHVLVALCDNHYQGIIPVPAAIGNGQDKERNLYWGAAYGMRTWFSHSKDWELLQRRSASGYRLERLVFRHRRAKYYLVADAYDGRYIASCTRDLLLSCSGQLKDTIQIGTMVLGINGNAVLLAYTGHDGLMDFRLPGSFDHKDGRQRDCMILACKSRQFFGPYLKATGARPLVWTTGLMCPEAYTLHAALNAYVTGAPPSGVRQAAAQAYSHYQKCSVKAARTLLVTGW